nr:hypothetical protein [Tanacetum cinerariifolium]
MNSAIPVNPSVLYDRKRRLFLRISLPSKLSGFSGSCLCIVRVGDDTATHCYIWP